MTVRRALIAISAPVLVALAAAQLAVGATRAPATTEPLRILAVNVGITKTKLTLDQPGAGFQNAVQFRVRNRTAVARTFAIGGQKVRVAPSGTRILLIWFEIRGKYAYVSTAPGQKTFRGVFNVV